MGLNRLNELVLAELIKDEAIDFEIRLLAIDAYLAVSGGLYTLKANPLCKALNFSGGNALRKSINLQMRWRATNHKIAHVSDSARARTLFD